MHALGRYVVHVYRRWIDGPTGGLSNWLLSVQGRPCRQDPLQLSDLLFDTAVEGITLSDVLHEVL